MLPFHIAPGMLVVFMVALAVVPLLVMWWDERHSAAAAERLARLRDEVSLREQLSRRARAEAGRRPAVVLPQG